MTTAEVRFMNLRSQLWRERDAQNSYMKCVFFNTTGGEFVFSDLDNGDPDAMSVHLTKDHQIRYLTADEVCSKVMLWMQTKQDTVVSRQDEVLELMEKLVANPDMTVDQVDQMSNFIPVEM